MRLLPRFSFLQNLRLWQKFALLGAFGLVAVAFPLYEVIKTTQQGIAVAQDERAGLPPTLALLRIIQNTQQHRGYSANVLSGNEALAESRAQAQKLTGEAIAEFGRLAAPKLATTKAMRDLLDRVQKDWQATSEAAARRRHTMAESFAAHTALVEVQIKLLDATADAYSLSLDPNVHTYNLVQAVVTHFPLLTEQAGQLRALGSTLLNEAARQREAGVVEAELVSAADRATLKTMLQDFNARSETAYRFLDKSMNASPALREKLESKSALALESVGQLVDLVNDEIIEAPAPSYQATAYFETFTRGIDAQFGLLTAGAESLQSELDLTVSNLRQSQGIAVLQISLILLAALGVSVLIVRNITNTVDQLQDAVQKVRGGSEAALEQIESRDEVGDLGRTVNLLLTERMAAQRKAEQENERLNDSVISLLQAVNVLSERDLTVRAPVTQDVIGTVSDSINALTDEIARVLNGVTRIAGQVADVSEKVKAQSALVAQTAEEERTSVGHMMDTLAETAQTMNQVAALAEVSNASAAQATLATDNALTTVTATVSEMESIRETIAETEKRIKRLGERSQEISGIVNLINTISERTHVLALNASMQAAVAGEAGRGFAVVAEEVQRLAENSRNATQQIASLVGNIQLETNETINTVNRTIDKVVRGSEQARKAGEQMRATQSITGDLVSQVRRIGDASDVQKTATVQLLEAIQQISQGTDRTARQIEQQNVETGTLLLSARQLVDSVNVFKLPATA